MTQPPRSSSQLLLWAINNNIITYYYYYYVPSVSFSGLTGHTELNLINYMIWYKNRIICNCYIMSRKCQNPKIIIVFINKFKHTFFFFFWQLQILCLIRRLKHTGVNNYNVSFDGNLYIFRDLLVRISVTVSDWHIPKASGALLLATS